MATKRQIKIVENFIKNETKRLMKEDSNQQIYNKILDLYRQGTEYSQSPEQIKKLTQSLYNFFNNKLKSL